MKVWEWGDRREVLAKRDDKKCEQEARQADSKIKICEKCKMAWERDAYNTCRINKTISYYEDFVTYGKEKKTCPNCKSKEG